MPNNNDPQAVSPPARQPNIFSLLKPYTLFTTLLVLLALLGNALNLVIPRFISRGIDSYTAGTFDMQSTILVFSSVTLLIFLFTSLQQIVQVVASERVGRDLRMRLADKISRQSYATIQGLSSAKLLTNLTADIESIKMFVALGISSLVSSLLLIIGSSVLLLMTNWKLALAVLTIIPLIGGTFYMVLSKVKLLFIKGREVIDRLNRVINESILGAATIRVLNSQRYEHEKFSFANTEARTLGLQILRQFAAMVPVIGFIANLATLIILVLGGHFVIAGTMTLGDFAAFNSYVAILIFPIFVLGFMSNILAQATASYQRINEVLSLPDAPANGTHRAPLQGDISLEQVSVSYGEKTALKNISFRIKGGTRTAVIGPTAAGKTQLLYLLTNLISPDSGTVSYDGKPIDAYDLAALHQQVGFVFQDSVLLNMTIRENIALNQTVTQASLDKAIATAELHDLVSSLPQGLDTIVSERGTSLSGGQKQRIMLARALALEPKVLLLDDFTARVDNLTEQKILQNVARNYPGITIISVTQKISSVENYDSILLLMEGELLAQGTHQQLLETSPEYVQIYRSQRSTNHYEES